MGGPKWGVHFFSVTSKWRADDAMSLDSTQQTKWFEGRHVCHLCGARLRTLLPHKCRIPPVPFPPVKKCPDDGRFHPWTPFKTSQSLFTEILKSDFWELLNFQQISRPEDVELTHSFKVADYSSWISQLGNEKSARTFLHKLFEHRQGSRTSRQHSQDIPDSSVRNPRKTNFRGRARTFRPPPLCVEDPHPTGRSPDPES